VLEVSKKALRLRYDILPIYNTLFYLAHTQTGSVMNGLFFEFPNDPKTWTVDEQFLIGSSLLVTPILHEGVSTVRAYFPPEAQWFDLQTGERQTTDSNGFAEVSIGLREPPRVHVRDGSILPIQKTTTELTTVESSRLPFAFVVTLSKAKNGKKDASGSLFFDDGDNLDVDLGMFVEVSAEQESATSGVVIEFTRKQTATQVDVPLLETVEVRNIEQGQQISRVEVDGKDHTDWDMLNGGVVMIRKLGVNMNGGNHVIRLHKL
jgi:alpha-glucosidase (family GH31 glycosyl hydrolase)